MSCEMRNFWWIATCWYFDSYQTLKSRQLRVCMCVCVCDSNIAITSGQKSVHYFKKKKKRMRERKRDTSEEKQETRNDEGHNSCSMHVLRSHCLYFHRVLGSVRWCVCVCSSYLGDAFTVRLNSISNWIRFETIASGIREIGCVHAIVHIYTFGWLAGWSSVGRSVCRSAIQLKWYVETFESWKSARKLRWKHTNSNQLRKNHKYFI